MPDNEDDPLFDLSDYVPSGGGLPEHLKGKSPEEVAQYYSGLLKEGETKAQERRATPPKKQETPLRSDDRPLKESDVQPIMGTMVQAAKMVAKTSLDADQQKLFDRFSKEISDLMTLGFKGAQLADAQNWIFAFNQVMGSKAHILIKEEREAAVKRTSEASSPPAQEPEKDIELTPLESEIGKGLGLGSEGYKSGKKILSQDKWPLTFSNT